MFTKEHIAKLLSVNGLSIDAPDEEIKSLLLSAHWHQDDVETAVMVLRENKDTHTTHVDTLHNIFRSDDRLKPETVSALLGINMELSADDLEKHDRYKRGNLPFSTALVIFFVSFSLAVGILGLSMWYLGVGAFHHSEF